MHFLIGFAFTNKNLYKQFKLMKKHFLLLLSFAILIVASIAYLLAKPQANQNKLDFFAGVCTHGNKSSEMFAIEHGVKYFRTDISNSNSQITLLDEEHTLGANYLGILDYSTLPGGISNKNWSLNQWNQSIEEAVKNYPWINTWEIWNEPYVSMFQTGFANGSAYNYYLLIESATKIIRKYQPNATIVCFGGAPIGSDSIFSWYKEVWNYGAGKYCNAISLHIYPSLPFSSNQFGYWYAWINAYENMTNKPIWITEFGMPSSSLAIQGLSQGEQNYFLVNSFLFFSKIPYIKRAYWYDLWGLSDGQEENNFGLLNLTNPQGKPSEAWYSFLQIYNESLSA